VLHQAVASGHVVKPDCCSECGKKGRVHGHHEDYAEPLQVTWLCSVCHGRRHSRNG
jgi:hypothetical protein